MRQTYLTSDNPTVVNRLRKDCREEWAGACSKLKNLKPCGRCGVKPVWRIQPDSARVECPKCGNGFSDDSEYYEIGRLALKWTMSQSGQGDAYRLESMLNG